MTHSILLSQKLLATGRREFNLRRAGFIWELSRNFCAVRPTEGGTITRDSHPRETDDQNATSVGQEICVEQAIRFHSCSLWLIWPLTGGNWPPSLLEFDDTRQKYFPPFDSVFQAPMESAVFFWSDNLLKIQFVTSNGRNESDNEWKYTMQLICRKCKA